MGVDVLPSLRPSHDAVLPSGPVVHAAAAGRGSGSAVASPSPLPPVGGALAPWARLGRRSSWGALPEWAA
eukprot:8051305-Pyramimonas_sp.AAC.1